MSYLVLARKWRPKGFDDLVGQAPIMRILTNAITQGKIAHAYIFSGPRGVGKTSSARILAKALNCTGGPTPTPCGACASCLSIADGSSVDVIEIDGASNNSVDDIRDLRERVKYAPSSGRYKVYIIDEVHMLSGSAFNALLKTLEEPPPHVIFVLATTEMKKIPATVLSRCQHMPFRRISSNEIRQRLKHISDAEGIIISPPALGLVARAADGSMRDSLTILDQISSFSAEISEQDVKNLLGITDFGLLAATAQALITGDRAALLDTVNHLTEQGTDIRAFTRELVQFFRDLLVASVVKKPEEVLDLGEDELRAVKDLTALAGEDQLTLMLSEIMKTEADIRFASSPRLALEMALIKASFLSVMKPVKEVLDRLAGLQGDASPAPRQKKTTTHPIAAPAPEVVTTVRQERPAPAAVEQWETASAGVQEMADAASAGVSDPSPAEVQEEKTFPPAAAPPSGTEGNLAASWDHLLSTVAPPLASKLSQTHYELKGDELFLTLNGGHAVFEDSLRENAKEIQHTLAAAYGQKLRIKIGTAPKRAGKKKSDLKETVMQEPLIKEALELFDGRIVDVTSVETENISNNGGDNV